MDLLEGREWREEEEATKETRRRHARLERKAPMAETQEVVTESEGGVKRSAAFCAA